ncbi:TrmH family RNA methyltransferase [Pseudoclavibacter sp. CFCC 11306]|uniref:TrmH family RNA methyltransferase n=1 Tax=Pseudoclavibacter sp. CFCC 11306 TaxID=1564493 RepID=UPI00130110A4|nr:RNA methyltransferase [Pseudoclavibacter sp. CFCC 11306]KAB1656926.1 RNA methyltransferase [Pseudoclavibacter sp. CFCC 11306]
MLSSVHNERVRFAASLARRDARSKTGRFLLDGPQAVAEAIRWRPQVVEQVYVAENALGRLSDLSESARAAGLPVETVTERVLKAMSDTVHPQGVVAVARQFPVRAEDLFSGTPRLVVIMHHVSDPGNAGTVLRVADAVGADGVVFTDRSVDVYNPKVVRSTTGSLFHLPVAVGVDLPDAMRLAHESGLQTLAADISGDELASDDATTELLSRPTAWLFGNEAHGLDDAELALADHAVRLPIYGQAESLNLAIAASVCLYQSAFRMHV